MIPKCLVNKIIYVSNCCVNLKAKAFFVGKGETGIMTHCKPLTSLYVRCTHKNADQSTSQPFVVSIVGFSQ